MKTEDVAYLNGFLQAMALVNVGTNHGSWYLLEPVARRGTPIESLRHHLREFFAWSMKRYGTGESVLDAQSVSDWRSTATHLAQRWFFAMECSPKLKEDYQPAWVTKDFIEKLESSLVGAVSAWSVEGASADIESADLLLEDQEGLVLLRFSWCD